MKRLWNRGIRLAVMTLGFAGLIVAVNAVPGAATPAIGLTPTTVARGTMISPGTLPITQGMDVVVVAITLDPFGTSGWHSHPGGAIAVVQTGELTLYKSVGNHCVITPYTAGHAFIEMPGDVVKAVAGPAGATLGVTFPGVVPITGSTRIDQPNPGTCDGV
jgi:quercetin dioxygenase-like cupin family protein